MIDFLGGVFSIVIGYYLAVHILKAQPNILALAAGAILGKVVMTYLRS
jgi:Kef-type K+ transport system membrane component KefB